MTEESTKRPGAPAGDVATDHDYDGIKEFDNPLPRWWLLTFYGTVVFSLGYWFFYHSLAAGDLPMKAYAQELARAAAEEDARLAQLEREGKGVTEERLWALSRDADARAQGEAIFRQNCVACHGDQGQGKSAPNLTDAYWLHGGKAKDLYRTVADGVPEKYMPTWKLALGPSKVQQVVGYVLSLRNKNLPGQPPQGVREGEEAPAEGKAPGAAGAPGQPARPAEPEKLGMAQ